MSKAKSDSILSALGSKCTRDRAEKKESKSANDGRQRDKVINGDSRVCFLFLFCARCVPK